MHKTRGTKLSRVQVLDCTIRDGGYVNDWAFDVPMVREVYRNVSKSGADFIELGFRNTLMAGSQNPWICVSEATLRKVVADIPGVPVALMLDGGKFDVADIPSARDSLVRMYRLAVHKKDVKSGIRDIARLKRKGYQVTLQLMGINDYADKDFKELNGVLKAAALDYLYFADSYGSLFPSDIPRIVEALRKTRQKLGYHPHNNLQLGFANTLAAIDQGVHIVDATIFGMGRGAGNLPLEVLVMYLHKVTGLPRYNVIPLLDLVDRYFVPVYQKDPWGYSLPYMLSGIFGIHPNYPKALVDRREYDMATVAKFLEFIKDQAPSGFDRSKLDVLVQKGAASSDIKVKAIAREQVQAVKAGRKIDYLGRHAGRDFLILANGASLPAYRSRIRKFIKKFKPVVIGVNFLDDLFVPDYHGFSNKKRFTQYVGKVSPRSKLLISSSFEASFIQEYTARGYETLLHVDCPDSHLDIIDGVITTNGRTVGLLMVAAAIAMGAGRIFIAGMDGYRPPLKDKTSALHFYNEAEEAEDLAILAEKHRYNQNMMDEINRYLLAHGKEGLHIITPTSYGRFYTDIDHWLKDF